MCIFAAKSVLVWAASLITPPISQFGQERPLLPMDEPAV
jgi:hypothetical protein